MNGVTLKIALGSEFSGKISNKFFSPRNLPNPAVLQILLLIFLQMQNGGLFLNTQWRRCTKIFFFQVDFFFRGLKLDAQIFPGLL
jgi:hypothetical protein